MSRNSSIRAGSAACCIMAVALASLAFRACGAIEVIPAEAAPGGIVLIRVEKPVFKTLQGITVRFGSEIAPVVEVLDERSIEVGVPQLEPGVVAVIVEQDGNRVGEGKAQILPSPMKRLFLSMAGDSITLARVNPYNGEFPRTPTSGRRLAFDVLSTDGHLIYTGAVRHPAVRTVEVPAAGDDPPWRRIPDTEPYWFTLTIPYTPGAVVVRIYDVVDGVDLSTARGRAERRLLREFRAAE